MNIYMAVGHAGIPYPGISLVFAPNEEEARLEMDRWLISRHLAPFGVFAYDLVQLKPTQPCVINLIDGSVHSQEQAP